MKNTTRYQIALWTIAAIVAAAALIAMWRRREVIPPPTIRSVAVFPFTTNSGNEAMAVSLAATLIGRLSTDARNVRVPSLSAVASAGQSGDPLVLGRALRVDAVLVGTLHATDSRVRVNASFLLVRDGRRLWERRLDYPLRDVGKVEESLSEALLESVTKRTDEGRLRP